MRRADRPSRAAKTGLLVSYSAKFLGAKMGIKASYAKRNPNFKNAKTRKKGTD
jgi:hypothetical protein